jgi:hypothetical protein
MFTFGQIVDNLKYFIPSNFILKNLSPLSSPRKNLGFILFLLILSIQNHFEINLLLLLTSFFTQLLRISSTGLLSFVMFAK